jgi:CheY-like chemotaxis protein
MSHTLLLADASVTTHRVVELIFAGQNIRVVSAADGEQAVERMRTLRPDIVLAETTLPRVDGYQLADHVRNTPELAGVPVVLLSGAFDVVDEPRVRAAGAVGTIVKPLESQAVIKRVKELLGISRKDEPPLPAGRLITPAGRPAGEASAPIPPPRQAHIPSPSAAWDELRQAKGLAPDTHDLERGPIAEEDYRDKLDETFDILDRQLSGSSDRRPPARPAAAPPPLAPPVDLAVEPPVFEVDRDWFSDRPESPESRRPSTERDSQPAAASPVASTAGADRITPDAPAAPVAPATTPEPVEHRTAPIAPIAPEADNRTAPPAPGPAHAPAAPIATGAPENRTVPIAPSTPLAPGAPVQVTDAFEAVFTTEPAAETSRPAASHGVSDAVVERIATRVAERLSEGVFIDIVTQIVTSVAERLVREEIARIRKKAEERKD